MSAYAATTPRLLSVASKLLSVLIILNLFCVLLFGGMILYSYSGEATIVGGLTKEYGAIAAQQSIPAIRWTMLVGLAMIAPIHMIFTRLRAMIGSISSNTIFSMANIRRLKVIGWALLATQTLDLLFGFIALQLDSGTCSMFNWTPSLTAWICVLLIFVLAQVFEKGVAMRDDLEGVV